MTATYSTIDAVILRTKALLDVASFPAPTVQVFDGVPDPASLTGRDAVWVDSVVDFDHEVPLMNGVARRIREETYTYSVFVWCSKARGQISDARSRAFALLHYVEDAIANDSTLGGTVTGLVHAIPTGGGTLTCVNDAEGARAVIEYKVRVLARLT